MPRNVNYSGNSNYRTEKLVASEIQLKKEEYVVTCFNVWREHQVMSDRDELK